METPAINLPIDGLPRTSDTFRVPPIEDSMDSETTGLWSVYVLATPELQRDDVGQYR